jgi:hypothetical protein
MYRGLLGGYKPLGAYFKRPFAPYGDLNHRADKEVRLYTNPFWVETPMILDLNFVLIDIRTR